jgi:maleate isomerase
MVRLVAKKNPDVILIMCTNMLGATVAATLAPELGIPIMDSASVALQSGLRLAG